MKLLSFLSLVLVLSACSKDRAGHKEIPVPNGDFENWSGGPLLQIWKTNSCPMCMTALDMYLVRQDSTPNHGQYAAKFIYNGISSAWGENKFAVPYHPTEWSAYVKGNVSAGDTVSISVKLLYSGVVVDSGRYLGITPLASWVKLSVPISQNTGDADSILIRIEGGRKAGTILAVDDMQLH